MSYQDILDIRLRQKHEEYSRKKANHNMQNVHQVKFFAYALFNDWYYEAEAGSCSLMGGHPCPLPFKSSEKSAKYQVKLAVFRVALNLVNYKESVCVGIRVPDELDVETKGYHKVKVEDDYVHILNWRSEYTTKLSKLSFVRNGQGKIVEPLKPREFDAVLGGSSPPPINAAVLGGIEGVKLRLKNPDAFVRREVLNDALKYEQAGIEVLIKTGLKDESGIVWLRAFQLLKTVEPKSDKLIEQMNKIAMRFFE